MGGIWICSVFCCFGWFSNLDRYGVGLVFGIVWFVIVCCRCCSWFCYLVCRMCRLLKVCCWVCLWWKLFWVVGGVCFCWVCGIWLVVSWCGFVVEIGCIGWCCCDLCFCLCGGCFGSVGIIGSVLGWSIVWVFGFVGVNGLLGSVVGCDWG